MTPDVVEVIRGTHKDPSYALGPLPGRRVGDVLAYEFGLPERFEPWPGRTRLERVFVLLDVGVSFARPCWRRLTKDDGSSFEVDPGHDGFWYVDLVTVEQDASRFTIRDLYIDVMVPTDGRHDRMLDLDEFADAVEAGTISLPVAIDGLRRWQRFLDSHLYQAPAPASEWRDFPPSSIRALDELPAPFGDIVRAE